MRISLVVACVMPLLFAGCAIHPLPEDVTGVSTFEIVKQIRCEAREALTGIIMEKLEDYAARGTSPEAEALLAQYRSNPNLIADFKPGLFPGQRYVELRRFINVFADGAIAYNFDLTMSENNGLSSSTSLLKSLVSPKFTSGIGAGTTLGRSNRRVFTTSDNFAYLVARLNRPLGNGTQYCTGKIVGENRIYPIAGRIGVDKSIRDFISMVVFGGLAGEKAQGAPAMTDNLAFTTAINASATPKVEFTPSTGAFQVGSSSLSASADRTDTHKVSIGLAIGPKGMKELALMRGFAFSSERSSAETRATGEGFYSGVRVSGGGTAAERRAVEAIDAVKRGEIQLIPAQ